MGLEDASSRRSTWGTLPEALGSLTPAQRMAVWRLYTGILFGIDINDVPVLVTPSDPAGRPDPTITAIPMDFPNVKVSGYDPDEIRRMFERLQAYFAQYLSDLTPSATGTASAGTSPQAARADHDHGVANWPGLGSATPEALGTAAAGDSAYAAHEDHVHAKPPLGTATPHALGTANAGSSEYAAHEDHIHQAPSAPTFTWQEYTA